MTTPHRYCSHCHRRLMEIEGRVAKDGRLVHLSCLQAYEHLLNPTTRLPTIIKEFPGQAVDAFWKERGCLPSECDDNIQGADVAPSQEGVGRTESAPGQELRSTTADPVSESHTPAPAAATDEKGKPMTYWGGLAADHSDTPEWSALQKKHRIEQTEFDSGKLKTMSAERDLKASQHNEEIELLISLERRLAAETAAREEQGKEYEERILRLWKMIGAEKDAAEVFEAKLAKVREIYEGMEAVFVHTELEAYLHRVLSQMYDAAK